MNDQGNRFTLEPGRWYAAEFIGDEFSGDTDHRSYSAIRVDRVTSNGHGHRVFELAFYHANYPEGVRNKVYLLKTLERTSSIVLAEILARAPFRDGARIVSASASWVHCRERTEEVG
jgi:hypothetical protein